MKNVKFLLSAACALFAVAAMAQQDFSDPKYAVWGDTPQEREQNILNSNFLKESLDNKDYNAAAHYLKELLDKCPKASQNTFVRGITLYKNKIARAKSIAEKNTYTDSLMIVYDLRNEYFGDHPKYGTPYILDRKAREYLMYKPADRKGIREAFRAAIEAGGDNTDPETVVAYFSNLCDDYKNTDEVMPDEIIAEYDRLTPFFEKNPAAAEYKSQFDAAFGLSGAASCENLEKLFKGKLAAAPDDEALLSQAVALMSRAKCDGDFYFSIAEKYYQVKPSSETAMFLAQAFQNKKDYVKAKTYLNEALDVEKDAVQEHRAGGPRVQRHSGSCRRRAPGPRPESRGRCAVLHPGAVLCFVGRFVQRFRRSGDLLGRLRYDGQGGRTAPGRFGVHGARQEFPR